jgi:hypothetical protein
MLYNSEAGSLEPARGSQAYPRILSYVLDAADDRPYLIHHLKEKLRPDLNSRNCFGRSTLLECLSWISCDTSRLSKIVDDLLKDGADPYGTDCDGNGVFHTLLSPTNSLPPEGAFPVTSHIQYTA